MSRLPYFLETLCPYFEKYRRTSVLPADFHTNAGKYGQVGRSDLTRYPIQGVGRTDHITLWPTLCHQTSNKRAKDRDPVTHHFCRIWGNCTLAMVLNLRTNTSSILISNSRPWHRKMNGMHNLLFYILISNSWLWHRKMNGMHNLLFYILISNSWLWHRTTAGTIYCFTSSSATHGSDIEQQHAQFIASHPHQQLTALTKNNSMHNLLLYILISNSWPWHRTTACTIYCFTSSSATHDPDIEQQHAQFIVLHPHPQLMALT